MARRILRTRAISKVESDLETKAGDTLGSIFLATFFHQDVASKKSSNMYTIH